MVNSLVLRFNVLFFHIQYTKLSKKYEISNKILPKESYFNEIVEKTSHLQQEFKLPVGPLSDPWQFRIYVETLIDQKNDV